MSAVLKSWRSSSSTHSFMGRFCASGMSSSSLVTSAGPIGAKVCQDLPRKKPPGRPRQETSMNCV